MKIGTTNVIRLYKQGYVLSTNPGGYWPTAPVDPTGKACVLNKYVVYNSNYYKCVRTEVTEMKNSANALMHKRVTVYYHPNGGSGSTTSAAKTWGVEYIGPFPTFYRTSYYLWGWATTSGAASPNVYHATMAPSVNTTYYAVWSRLKDVNYMYDDSEEYPNVNEIIFMGSGEVSNPYDMAQVRQFLLDTLEIDGNPIHIYSVGYRFAIANQGMQTNNIFEVVLGD